MKICFTGNSSWSIYNYRKELIQNLLKSHSIFILAPDEELRHEFENLGCKFLIINLDRRSKNPLKELFFIYKLRRIFKEYRFDYVLSFNIKPNLYSCFSASFLGTKVIPNVSGLGSTFLESSLLFGLIKLLYRFSFRNAHHIFFQNNDDRELFIELKIINQNSSSVLPGSGINLDYFIQDNDHLLEYSGVTTFTFIGRIIRDKGINEFLLAANYFKDNSKFLFNIVGGYDENNPSSISKESINKLLATNINYLGEFKDIRKVLKNSTCIVLPSYREGMSRSLLEAAATGIPIIATNVPGCKEIINDGISGFLVEPRDVASLVKCFKVFQKLSTEDAFEMGCKGRILVEEKFSVDQIINLYNSKLLPDS